MNLEVDGRLGADYEPRLCALAIEPLSDHHLSSFHFLSSQFPNTRFPVSQYQFPNTTPSFRLQLYSFRLQRSYSKCISRLNMQTVCSRKGFQESKLLREGFEVCIPRNLFWIMMFFSQQQVALSRASDFKSCIQAHLFWILDFGHLL